MNETTTKCKKKDCSTDETDSKGKRTSDRENKNPGLGG